MYERGGQREREKERERERERKREREREKERERERERVGRMEEERMIPGMYHSDASP